MTRADLISVRPWKPSARPVIHQRLMRCRDCGAETERRSPRQKYCPTCGEEHRRKAMEASNARRRHKPTGSAATIAPEPYRDPRFAELDRLIASEAYRLPGKRTFYRWLAEAGYKRCYCCETVKRIDDFYRIVTARDGRAAECKECSKVRATDWRHIYPDKHREYQRNSYRRRIGLEARNA